MADDSGSSVVGEHPVSDLSDNSDQENPQEHEEHVVHDSSEDEQGHLLAVNIVRKFLSLFNGIVILRKGEGMKVKSM